LLQGAVIGAGVLASNVPATKALTAGQPLERRTLQGLAWNDPIVATYRDGIGLLKQKAAGVKSGWVGLAGIHGLNLRAYHFCPHGNWYLLPWHRAYILTYERFIRELTGNRDFALPYWDWTNDPTMPEVFLKPTTPDGKKNWLFVDDQDFGQDWKRSWPDSNPMPPRFVGPSVRQDILHFADYEQLGTSPSGRPGQPRSFLGLHRRSGHAGAAPTQHGAQQYWRMDASHPVASRSDLLHASLQYRSDLGGLEFSRQRQFCGTAVDRHDVHQQFHKHRRIGLFTQGLRVVCP
jgi:hypothetical protein